MFNTLWGSLSVYSLSMQKFEVEAESIFYWIPFYRDHQSVILILFSSDFSIVRRLKMIVRTKALNKETFLKYLILICDGYHDCTYACTSKLESGEIT